MSKQFLNELLQEKEHWIADYNWTREQALDHLQDIYEEEYGINAVLKQFLIDTKQVRIVPQHELDNTQFLGSSVYWKYKGLTYEQI